MIRLPVSCFSMMRKASRQQRKTAVRLGPMVLFQLVHSYLSDRWRERIATGAVDQQIEPAPFGDRVFEALDDLGFVCHVGIDALANRAGGRNVGNHRLAGARR